MQGNVRSILIIALILLICAIVSAIEVEIPIATGVVSPGVNQGVVGIPQVSVPNVAIDKTPSVNSDIVGLYLPAPPCYECMPEPTPAPVYQTIGISVSPTSLKVKENAMVTLQATQISGPPVLESATWDWIITTPRYRGDSAKGKVISFKANEFGNWKINLNVRDKVQMLNGHLNQKISITKK